MKWTQFYFNECENKDYCFGVPGNICNHYRDVNIKVIIACKLNLSIYLLI